MVCSLLFNMVARMPQVEKQLSRREKGGEETTQLAVLIRVKGN